MAKTDLSAAKMDIMLLSLTQGQAKCHFRLRAWWRLLRGRRSVRRRATRNQDDMCSALHHRHVSELKGHLRHRAQDKLDACSNSRLASALLRHALS